MTLHSQKSIVISKINIEGNKRTKEFIIRRELDIKVGDTIFLSDTSAVFLSNKNKVFNTSLFNSVEVSSATAATTENKTEITIHVTERWYIFPLPILELADRNINVWRTQHNTSFKRLEWGVNFQHDNFLGRNQKLEINLQAGFTKKYEVFHQLPFINKKKTVGITYGLSYSTNKSVGYNQEENKLLFHNSENNLRKRFYGALQFTFRPKYYVTQSIGLAFHHNRISDELFDFTTFYLGEGLTVQRFLRLFYKFNLNKTDINYYPTKGYELNLEATKVGLGLTKEANQTFFEGYYNKYFIIKPKFYSAHKIALRTSNPVQTAYILQRGFGYEETFVRGYQPYVVDGQHYALSRNEIKYNFLNFTKTFGKWIPIKEFRTVPYSFYIKLFSDYGIVNNADSRLNSSLQNRLTSGHGIGLDIASYYDTVLRIEFAVNDRLEKGIYFHLDKGI